MYIWYTIYIIHYVRSTIYTIVYYHIQYTFYHTMCVYITFRRAKKILSKRLTQIQCEITVAIKRMHFRAFEIETV